MSLSVIPDLRFALSGMTVKGILIFFIIHTVIFCSAFSMGAILSLYSGGIIRTFSGWFDNRG